MVFFFSIGTCFTVIGKTVHSETTQKITTNQLKIEIKCRFYNIRAQHTEGAGGDLFRVKEYFGNIVQFLGKRSKDLYWDFNLPRVRLVAAFGGSFVMLQT